MLVIIFFPFLLNRQEAYNAITDLMKNYIVIHANANTEIIGGVFMKYEMILQFISRMFFNPALVDIISPKVIQIIKFCNLTHQSLNPRPSIFTFKVANQSFLQIAYLNDQNEDFILSYLKEENNVSCFYSFSSNETDFSNWDPINSLPQNKKIDCSSDIYNLSRLNNIGINENMWLNMYPIIYNSSSIPELVVMTALGDQNNDTITQNSISVNMKDISNLIDSFISLDGSHYALINLDGKVIFDSESGDITPLGVDKEHMPIYPTLDQLGSPIWSKVSEVIENIGIHELRNFTLGDSTYFVIVSSILSYNVETHRFILVMNRDSAISNAYYQTSSLFIIFIAVVAVLFTISKFGINQSHKNKERKLKLKQESSFDLNDPIEDCGIIGSTISRLRKLELLYPEDLMLNKVLDSAVVNFTEKERCRYVPVNTVESIDCGFCDKLIMNDDDIINNDESVPYNIWTSFSYSLFNDKFEIPKKFKYEYFENKPAKQLIKLFMSIITEDKLLIKSIDPDALVRFVARFSNNFCKDPTIISHILYRIHILVCEHFHNWITSSVDLLALYISVIINWTCFDNIFPTVEQILKEENYFENELYSDILVFQDERSASERKASFIIGLLNEYFANADDPVIQHFFKVIKELYVGTNDKLMFQLLGKFRIRIESPEFSVSKSMKDRLLFMKVLVKFGEFSPYIENNANMLKGLEHQDKLIFSEEELLDTRSIAEFHYEKASKIVQLWIDILSKFCSFHKFNKHLDLNIDYWKAMIQETNECEASLSIHSQSKSKK